MNMNRAGSLRGLTAVAALVIAATCSTVAAGPAISAAAVSVATTSARLVDNTVRVIPAPAPVAPIVHVQPVSFCGQAEAYESAHAKPGTTVVCPAYLPAGIVATTGDVNGQPVISMSPRACFTAWENEASNSYWDFAATPPTSYQHTGVDANGRHVDPYGEC